MTQPYEIDTSVLVRLTAGKRLLGTSNIASKRFVHWLRTKATKSSLPISGDRLEAYIAIQHHYGIADAAAKDALVDVLNSGLVSPRESATHH